MGVVTEQCVEVDVVRKLLEFKIRGVMISVSSKGNDLETVNALQSETRV